MYKIRDSLSEQNIKKFKSECRFFISVAFILLLIVVVLTLNTYVFFNVLVDGGSMRPTLSSGDVLVANRHKEIKRGSIVVIDGEKSDGKGGYVWLIKRVIAMEGDTVEITNGAVYINGYKLEEPYLPSGTLTEDDDWIPTKLKENEIFYLGDNRGNSADSRFYGLCVENQVVGVVEEWSIEIRWLNKIFYKISNFFRSVN